MTREQANDLVRSSLATFAANLPNPLNENLFLMRDLNLESVDLLNVLVEIERRVKAKLDLIDIMRGRDDLQVYQRDLKVGDLVNYLERLASSR